MKVFFDTSVIVAAMLESHPAHEPAFSALERVQAKVDEGVVGQHSLAEVYGVLTAIPRAPRISPIEACRCVEDNLITQMQIVPLTPQDYRHVLAEAAAHGWRSGMIYDALLLACARKVSPDRILRAPHRLLRTTVTPAGAALSGRA